MSVFVDRVHRLPRVWSNRELRKFAHVFHGDVVNVSGWKDVDKEGSFYRDYFENKRTYTITNYKASHRGFQGRTGEIYLDLEADLDEELRRRFDVAFNHTTLEHVYHFQRAFENLCEMSKDVVIIVLPFLQQYHSDYGDYWRFTPLAVKRMFEANGLILVYQSFNLNRNSSVYTFSIASRHPENWAQHFDWEFSCNDPRGRGNEPFIGCRAVFNFAHSFRQRAASLNARVRALRNIGTGGE